VSRRARWWCGGWLPIAIRARQGNTIRQGRALPRSPGINSRSSDGDHSAGRFHHRRSNPFGKPALRRRSCTVPQITSLPGPVEFAVPRSTPSDPVRRTCGRWPQVSLPAREARTRRRRHVRPCDDRSESAPQALLRAQECDGRADSDRSSQGLARGSEGPHRLGGRRGVGRVVSLACGRRAACMSGRGVGGGSCNKAGQGFQGTLGAVGRRSVSDRGPVVDTRYKTPLRSVRCPRPVRTSHISYAGGAGWTEVGVELGPTWTRDTVASRQVRLVSATSEVVRHPVRRRRRSGGGRSGDRTGVDPRREAGAGKGQAGDRRAV
jgi:hypothetical protein